MQIKRKKIMCFSFFFFWVQEEESITRAINTWNMDKRWDSRPGIKQQWQVKCETLKNKERRRGPSGEVY
jgi:hypothetical protein